VKAANPGITELARWGVVNDTTAASVADQTQAELRANPDISVVIAPYDEFARGVKLGATQLGVADKIKIYSADISTSDIQEMIEPGSPWVATAATNPAVVGAVSIRAVALAIAGQDPGHNVVVQPTLITQADLKANNITTVEELQKNFPAFAASDAATADWIPTPGQ
jgi:simple sugar transport system substrate-binding protein